MSLIYDSINKLNSMSGTKLLKYMTDNYSLDEEKLDYLVSNFTSTLINADEDLYEKLFINNFDGDIIDKLHFKYYQIPLIGKCHIKKIDAYAMINSMIYIDGMEELYNLLSGSIMLSPEEFIFCYSVAIQSGSINDCIKKVKERYKVEKSN